MKHTIKFLEAMRSIAIIALVAVIGFSMTACDGLFGDDDESGTAPNTPTGVSATAVSSSSITVTWIPVTGATGYTVYRSSSSGGTYTSVGTPTTISYTDTGLTADTTYYYKVSAKNASGSSAQSAYASAKTNTSGGGPTALPAGYIGTWVSTTGTYAPYTLTVTTNSIRLEANNGGYKQIASAQFTAASNTNNTHRTQYPNGYTFTGTETYDLVNGSSWALGFIALSTDGQSVYMGATNALAIIVASGPVFTKQSSGGTIAAPTGVTATAVSSTSIRIDWNAVPGAIGYVVYSSSSANGTYEEVAGASETSPYLKTGLTPNTTYYYKVRATSATVSSEFSAYATATTLPSDGGTPVDLPASYHGTWVSTTGSYQPYTLTVSATTIRWEDKDGDFIQYASMQFTAVANTHSTYRTQHPNGYTFTGTRTSSSYNSSDDFGFIALSADGQTMYLGTNATTAFTKDSSGPIYTKETVGPNPLFTGRWKPLRNGEDDIGFYIFSNDGTYEMSGLVDTTDSLVKGTHTATGTTSGNYTLTPTHINGTLLLEFLSTQDSLFKAKLQAKWYTAEEYAAMVLNFVEVEVPAALAAETAIRYAEIDADDTLTPEEKATAKEWVDFELGLKYTLGEILLPMITVALTAPIPGVYDDPALNGTATYALTNSNNTLTFTVVSKSKDSETGVITPNTATTTLRRVN